MNLERLGATAELRASLFRIAPDLTLARVTVSHRDQYRLIADSGDLDADPAALSGTTQHVTTTRAPPYRWWAIGWPRA